MSQHVVEVEPAGPGVLVVRWAVPPEVPVEVSVGPTPDLTDHRRFAEVAAGQAEVRLGDLPPGRHYISITPAGSAAVVLAERRVGFEGPLNFRDLGGYETSSGGRTRWGRLYRSDALHRLTSEDLKLYGQLGLRAVYDLRNDDEREQWPNPVPSRAIALERFVTRDEFDDGSTLRTAEEAERRIRDVYAAIISTGGPIFGELFESLGRPGGLPAVFHCAGGKDRTGLTAALLLSWLGVDRETVLDDYELTGRWITQQRYDEVVGRFVAAGMSTKAAAALLGAPRWAMAKTLDDIDEKYGGVDGYLRGPAGLGSETLSRLHEALVH